MDINTQYLLHLYNDDRDKFDSILDHTEHYVFDINPGYLVEKLDEVSIIKLIEGVPSIKDWKSYSGDTLPIILFNRGYYSASLLATNDKNINVKGKSSNRTYFMMVIKKDLPDRNVMIKWILDTYNIDVRMEQIAGIVDTGNIELFELICSKYNFNNWWDDTPDIVLKAIVNSKMKTKNQWIESLGTKISYGSTKWTSSPIVICRGKYLPTLVKYGANMDRAYRYMVENDHITVIVEMLKLGLSPNVVNSNKYICVFALSNATSNFDILKSYGVSLTAIDKYGMTPMDVAINSHDEVLLFKLVSSGVNPAPYMADILHIDTIRGNHVLEGIVTSATQLLERSARRRSLPRNV